MHPIKVMDLNTAIPTIRTILLPKDTNWHGTIFGGVILSYIDLAGGMEATKSARDKEFVTIAMDEVRFWNPVYVGDTLSFYTSTEKIGNTSITVKVHVEAIRKAYPHERKVVTEAMLTFVAIKDGKKIPIRSETK